MDYAAAISLDLAFLYQREARHDVLVQLLTETLPFFEAFQLGREYLTAIKLLRQAVSRQRVSVALLHQMRSFLENMMPLPFSQS